MQKNNRCEIVVCCPVCLQDKNELWDAKQEYQRETKLPVKVNMTVRNRILLSVTEVRVLT